MPISLFVGKAPLGMSRQYLQLLKEMQGERREENMVVLLFTARAFDIFTGEEPGPLFQIDNFPFALQQLTHPAQSTLADPECKLAFLL